MTRYGDIARVINGLRSPRASLQSHMHHYFPLRRECRMLSAALYARVRLHTPLHTRPRVQRAPGIPCALFFERCGNYQQNSGASRREIAELYSVQATSLRAQRLVRRSSTSEGGSNPSFRVRGDNGLLRGARNDESLIRNNSQQTAPASVWRLGMRSALDVNGWAYLLSSRVARPWLAMTNA